ncbi:hypothetical protein G4G28_00260 [Massilia sp. Dwa41.01b]|uniref:hypothetical protein n=1 Tax=Massilia sp. Dwa41.01b TaxID=2709302 RepID=UPI001601B26C|nr:hypothetical protein [Massilia sp. Dwa41.01b]QNA87284.1 hypothetical protein G4G28_00260 [Massilia sp. Dwa41.01b]
MTSTTLGGGLAPPGSSAPSSVLACSPPAGAAPSGTGAAPSTPDGVDLALMLLVLPLGLCFGVWTGSRLLTARAPAKGAATPAPAARCRRDAGRRSACDPGTALRSPHGASAESSPPPLPTARRGPISIRNWSTTTVSRHERTQQ